MYQNPISSLLQFRRVSISGGYSLMTDVLSVLHFSDKNERSSPPSDGTLVSQCTGKEPSYMASLDFPVQRLAWHS